MTDPMAPRALLNAVTFEKAREICETAVTSDDPAEIADALEAAASDAEVAHAVMFYLLGRIRGFPDETGVELGGHGPSFTDLWTPA